MMRTQREGFALWSPQEKKMTESAYVEILPLTLGSVI